MNPIILAIGLLIVLVLAVMVGYWVGAMIATGAAETRVIDYVNNHPSRQMFRMADRLYGDKRLLYAEPWGELPEKPEQVSRCTSCFCIYPTCECPSHMIPNNDDQQLFI